MDSDIQFGHVQETRPAVHLRPDRNRHFAAARVGFPDENDLPIFVDLDVMREIEEHAQSDTQVELGGVILGGQYEDREEKPFVVVTDSLRAQHYESTKGSFKFTHDTWEQITREREQFVPDLQMVGWYHTHPGWGLFLSAMDTFICDNFFNRPLDVALVIDPCRQARGFFQWEQDPQRRVRSTGGFYLIASRFRQEELDDYAAFLEGTYAMSTKSRTQGYPPAAFPGPPAGPGNSYHVWQNVAVLGSLTVQFCLLVLIAWRVLSSPTAPHAADTQQQLSAIYARISEIGDAGRRGAELDAKIEVLDQVVAQTGEETPTGLVRLLAERAGEVSELQSALRASRSLEKDLDARIAAMIGDLEDSRRKGEQLRKQLDELQTSLSQLRSDNEVQKARIENLEATLAAYEHPEAGPGGPSRETSAWWWTRLGVGAALAALVIGGGGAMLLRRRSERRQGASAHEKHDQPANPP